MAKRNRGRNIKLGVGCRIEGGMSEKKMNDHGLLLVDPATPSKRGRPHPISSHWFGRGGTYAEREFTSSLKLDVEIKHARFDGEHPLGRSRLDGYLDRHR